jgi:RNA polymerase sigma-70 factor (ECF subfamily)
VADEADPAFRRRREGPDSAHSANNDGDFVELYLEHYSRLVRALTIAGADRFTAQDLTQEAFARTFQRWRRVRAGPNPAGYLYTVAFRLLRRRRPFTETPLDDADLPGVPPLEEAVLNVAIVRQALAEMAPRQRACVALCLYLGRSTAEAAELLGVSPSTVRVQLHRARQRLRMTAGDTKFAYVSPLPLTTARCGSPRHPVD